MTWNKTQRSILRTQHIVYSRERSPNLRCLKGFCVWIKMGDLGHDSALQGYTGPRTTWADGINFIMNHVPGTGSIARPVDQKSSALPLCYSYESPPLCLDMIDAILGCIECRRLSRLKGNFAPLKFCIAVTLHKTPYW